MGVTLLLGLFLLADGPAVDERTTFLCRFDTGAAADFSVGSPYAHGVVALAPGRVNSALLARGGILPYEQTVAPFFTGLEYETAGNLNLAEGTGEMWVQPLFDTRTSPSTLGKLHYLFSSGKYVGELHAFAMLLVRGAAEDAPFTLVWSRQNGAKKIWSTAVPIGWPAGAWHHVAVTWSEQEDVLYVDGQPVGRFAAAEPMDFVEDTFALGSNIYNTGVADCAIDEVRLSDVVRRIEG